MSARRSDDDLVADILEACGVGAEIVERGRETFDADPVVRYAAETVLVVSATPPPNSGPSSRRASAACPGEKMIGMRIIVDHAYHRIDPGRLWNTLATDLSALRQATERHRGR